MGPSLPLVRIYIHTYTSAYVPLQELVEGVRRRKDAVQRWRNTRTLVIDEISMVDAGTGSGMGLNHRPLHICPAHCAHTPPRAATFDALSAVGAAIRCVDLPFGGMQL